MGYTSRAIDSKTPLPIDADPLPIGKRRYRVEPQHALGGEGASQRNRGDHPSCDPHRTRSGPRSLLSGRTVQLPYICPAKRPSPQDDPLHHGNAGIGQPLKMRRLPPPLSHGRFPFGAPARPPWKGLTPRLCRALSAGPMASEPHPREAVGSSFKMRPPITAAHARCDEAIPRSIDRAVPPADGCCLLSSPYMPSRGSAVRWFRPHRSSRGAMRDKAQGEADGFERREARAAAAGKRGGGMREPDARKGAGRARGVTTTGPAPSPRCAY